MPQYMRNLFKPIPDLEEMLQIEYLNTVYNWTET